MEGVLKCLSEGERARKGLSIPFAQRLASPAQHQEILQWLQEENAVMFPNVLK